MNLIYYSLCRNSGLHRPAGPAANGAPEHQWIHSIRSLRRYNRELPVYLFVYDGLSDEVLREADRNNVRVYTLGSYQEYIHSLYAHGMILSLYPTLHKFLCLQELDTSTFSQVLYVDCDTFFFDDPAILLNTYAEYDWYAREAPTSRRCPHGYDPSNIDETVLDFIVQQERLTPIYPFNAGVCVLNNGIWRRFNQLRKLFLDTVWRLLCGRHKLDHSGADGIIQNAVRQAATEMDYFHALPYPSSNYWIVEEVALWLTLGRIPGITQGFLSWDHVTQGGEWDTAITAIQPGRNLVVTHYFSAMEKKFFGYIAGLKNEGRLS